MFGRTTATLINLCLFIAPLVAVTLGAGSIAGEKDTGTLEHLLAQPFDRSEILYGKFLGIWIALTGATIVGFAPAAVAISMFGAFDKLLHFMLFPALAASVASAMLAIGFVISVRSDSRASAQTTAILLWFGFVLAYDLLLLGSLAVVRLPASALGFMLLLNPIDTGRVLATLALDPELYVLGPAGAYLVDTLGSIGAAALLVSALAAWTVLPLMIAVKIFEPARKKVVSNLDTNTVDTPMKKNRVLGASMAGRAMMLVAITGLVSLFAAGCGEKKEATEGASSSSSTTSVSEKKADLDVAMGPENVAKGKEVYLKTCAPCHGEGGKGDGPAAAALNPKPRDHTNGAYMDTLTNQHLYTVIKQGGASFGFPTMPAQPQLSDDDVKNTIAFVRSLSPTYKK
jgi:Cu-processing system permease protein